MVGGETATRHQRPLLGSAALVSLATSLSRLGGLAREQLFAALLGAGMTSDAFVVAFRIPNLLRDLLAEGALSTAFVPTFTQHLLREGKPAAHALANLVLTTLFVVTCLVVIVGWIFAAPIVQSIAPGFAATPGKIELTTTLTRILLPFLPMVALAAVLMGMSNAEQRFFVPALAPALFNVAAIAVALALLAGDFGDHPTVLAWTGAVLLGGFLQMAVQIPSLVRHGWRYEPRFRPRFDDPGLRRILRLMGPAVLGLSATQVNIFVNNILASQLVEGSASWLNYAFRLMQLPIGVFGVAVATVSLTSLSRHAAALDMNAFRATLADALRLIAFLTVPATAGLVALRQPIIELLYEHGRFSASDTAATAAVLSMYAVGLYAYAAVKVMAPAFYALQNARIPLAASACAVACNIAASLLLYRRLGAAGLALGTSVGAVVNLTILYTSFVRRRGTLGELVLLGQLGRVVLAALVMAIVCHWLASELNTRVPGNSIAADCVVTLVPIAIGAPIYFGLATLLRLPEARLFKQRLLRRRTPA